MNLTIAICSNRWNKLDQCLQRLRKQPGINLVEVLVITNPSESGIDNVMFDCFPKDYKEFRFMQAQSLSMARNMAVSYCKTACLTFLDDDDYYSVDAIYQMLEDICRFKEAGMIQYGVEKEGRLDHPSGKSIVIESDIQKLRHLNKFDDYELDRDKKMYLWNCATVFDVADLRNYNITWKCNHCDDTFPITDLYFNTPQVVRVQKTLYYYTIQNTVTKSKDLDSIKELENELLYSYIAIQAELLSQNDNKKIPYIKRLMLERCIQNSIRQLEVIESYHPKKLIDFKNEIKSK